MVTISQMSTDRKSFDVCHASQSADKRVGKHRPRLRGRGEAAHDHVGRGTQWWVHAVVSWKKDISTTNNFGEAEFVGTCPRSFSQCAKR